MDPIHGSADATFCGGFGMDHYGFAICAILARVAVITCLLAIGYDSEKGPFGMALAEFLYKHEGNIVII
jgi:hypothetical protein